MATDVEKQDLSQNRQSQLSADTLETRGDGGPESKEGLTRVIKFSKFSRYFQVNVTTRNADVLLLTCCLISGLTDSAIYAGMPAWFFAQLHPTSPFRTEILLNSIRDICINANWYVIDIPPAFLTNIWLCLLSPSINPRQHRLRRARWLQWRNNQQTLWLGQIFHLNCLLRHRLPLLLTAQQIPGTAAPYHPRQLFHSTSSSYTHHGSPYRSKSYSGEVGSDS